MTQLFAYPLSLFPLQQHIRSTPLSPSLSISNQIKSNPNMESSPMNKLPQDTLHHIFSLLPLRQIIISKSVCKALNRLLSSPSFLDHLSSAATNHRNLLALRLTHLQHLYYHNRDHRRSYNSLSLHAPPINYYLHTYDPDNNQWIQFSLDFLPFFSHYPVASSGGLLYLWAMSVSESSSSMSLVVCNPLTRVYTVLPQLGSAWSRHGSVLVDSVDRVMVLTELAALYLSRVTGSSTSSSWVTFSSNLPSKPRSPILVSDSVFALCDVGSSWRPSWKLFMCRLSSISTSVGCSSTSGSNAASGSGSCFDNWVCLERQEWGHIFDIVKRPRLVRGKGCNKILMIGGLKLTLSLNPSCLTIVILRLDLERMEWEEAGRMPEETYRCFQESSKLKVFGGGDRVCFSAKSVRKLALWEDVCEAGGIWRWIDGVPGGGDGLRRGFVFEARLNALP